MNDMTRQVNPKRMITRLISQKVKLNGIKMTWLDRVFSNCCSKSVYGAKLFLFPFTR